MQNHEVVAWIRKALRADYYLQFSVDIEGRTSSTEGYASDMFFVKVVLADNDKKRKELDLAVKFAKNALRKIPIFANMYKKEIYFYTDLLELFREHQNEKNVSEPFDGVPVCHSAYSDDDMDIIFLENLSKRGFRLHPRQSTMNLRHIKILFKNFAKFHAISFSIKAQKAEVFEKMIKDKFALKQSMLPDFSSFYKNSIEKVLKTLKEINRADLLEKFGGLVKQGIEKRIADIIAADVDEAVVVHSDCHNNNFLFQYKDENREDPLNVAIVDWQIARYHSPAFDLGYLLYSLSSKTELSESMNLLKFYHEELTSFLKQLGSDVDSIFPWSTLMDHWNKYSFYGFAYACFFMDWNFVSNENAVSLDNVDQETSVSDGMAIDLKLDNPDLYTERLIGILEHYFNEKH